MLDPSLYVHGIPGLDEALPIDVYAELSDLTPEAVFKLVKARCFLGVEHDGEWYVEAPPFGEDELRTIWRRRSERSEKSQKQSQKNNDSSSGGNGKKQAENRVVDLDRFFAKVLGLNGQVTKADIKKKWRELSMQYHPDKVQHLGPKLREVAEQEMKLINEAYEHFRVKYKI